MPQTPSATQDQLSGIEVLHSRETGHKQGSPDLHQCNLGFALRQEVFLGLSSPRPAKVRELGHCTRKLGSQHWLKVNLTLYVFWYVARGWVLLEGFMIIASERTWPWVLYFGHLLKMGLQQICRCCLMQKQGPRKEVNFPRSPSFTTSACF